MFYFPLFTLMLHYIYFFYILSYPSAILRHLKMSLPLINWRRPTYVQIVSIFSLHQPTTLVYARCLLSLVCNGNFSLPFIDCCLYTPEPNTQPLWFFALQQCCYCAEVKQTWCHGNHLLYKLFIFYFILEMTCQYQCFEQLQ